MKNLKADVADLAIVHYHAAKGIRQELKSQDEEVEDLPVVAFYVLLGVLFGLWFSSCVGV